MALGNWFLKVGNCYLNRFNFERPTTDGSTSLLNFQINFFNLKRTNSINSRTAFQSKFEIFSNESQFRKIHICFVLVAKGRLSFYKKGSILAVNWQNWEPFIFITQSPFIEKIFMNNLQSIIHELYFSIQEFVNPCLSR